MSVHVHDFHRAIDPEGVVWLCCPCGEQIEDEPEPNDGEDGEEWNLDEDPFLREGQPEFNGAFR